MRGLTDLLGVAREVVGGLAGARVSGGDLSVPAVVGLEDGELVALGVLDLDVELAVLAVVGRADALPGLRNKVGVQQRDGGQVRRELARDCTSRATGAGKGEANDGNLMARRGVGEGINENRRGRGKASHEGENGELHRELF